MSPTTHQQSEGEPYTYSPKQNVIKDVIFFRAKPLTNNIKPQLEEVSMVKYVSIEEAYKIITYEEDKEILKRIVGSDNNEY